MEATQSNPPNQQDNSAKIAQLVRAGLMKSSDLPTLKMAMRKHGQVGDVARLSKQHRDVLNRYNTALQSAALGSVSSLSAIRRNLNNSVEFTDKEQISERLKDELSPPVMLVLKRKGIRIFPDGKRVALYTNDKLGLVFTIPYSGAGTSPTEMIPGVQAEETDIIESFDQVVAYASQDNPKSLAKHMKFADGSKLKVSHGAAKAIHLVHGALNDDNKKKFADMLTTPKGFEKAAHFALSKVEYKIGGK